MISISSGFEASPMKGLVQPAWASGPASVDGAGSGPQPEAPTLTARAAPASAISAIAARAAGFDRGIAELRRARQRGAHGAAPAGSLAADVVLLRVVVDERVAVLVLLDDAAERVAAVEIRIRRHVLLDVVRVEALAADRGVGLLPLELA